MNEMCQGLELLSEENTLDSIKIDKKIEDLRDISNANF